MGATAFLRGSHLLRNLIIVACRCARQVRALYQMFGYMSQPRPIGSEQWRPAVPAKAERSGASVNVPLVNLDLAKLLTDHAGPIVGALIATIGGIVGGLIVRGTARSSSRKERTDEYRREVRSAASSIVRAARTFIDAATAFNRSIFWIQDAVRTTPDHDESYLACQAARAELDEKVADFQFLGDIDVLSDAAFMVYIHASMAYYAMFNINSSSEWANYTEAKLEDEREQIRKFTNALEKKALPKFRESVKKYVPHTIVEEKRRRTRIPRALIASWRWLMKQHRKNLPPSPPR